MKEPKPIKHHVPILTIKIKNVVIQSSIGKEWFIEINPVDFGTEPKRPRLGKQNTLILQKPWNTNQPESASLQIKITEKDKISDIFGPEDFNLNIDKTLPIDNDPDPKIISGHRKGQKIISITVAGSGGDKGKTAKVQIFFEWFLSSNMHDLVAYILNEMTNNLNTPEFFDLKKILDNTNKLKNSTNLLLAILNPQESIAISEYNKIKAYLNFTELVGYRKIWDHKELIYKTCGEWSLDAEKGTSYRFDLFSNIHYGFIGRAAGLAKMNY